MAKQSYIWDGSAWQSMTAPVAGSASFTDSAGLAAALSDETGTGSVVFGTGPTLSLPIINNIKTGYSTTAMSAGTTILTSTSNFKQVFTGSGGHTIQLPDTTTLAVGQSFIIINSSTSSNVSINGSSGTNFFTVSPNQQVEFTCILNSGTTIASWNWRYTGFLSLSGSGQQVVLATGPSITTPYLSYPSINGTIYGLDSITTSGGTTTLSYNSYNRQVFTGSSTQTVTLPSSLITTGMSFEIFNLSTGNVTVNASGGALVALLNGGESIVVTANAATPTTASGWNVLWNGTSTELAVGIDSFLLMGG